VADIDDLAFRMIDEIYYVGIERVSSHLMTSDAGHILIDTCMPDSGPAILEHITHLGFEPKDVRYILISHAHIDHLGSAKFLAAQTGAKVCVGAADVAAAETGSTTKMGLTGFEPFKVDMALSEGDVVAVGDKQIRVCHTPGHTPGCCAFVFTVRADGKEYAGALFGGPGLNVFNPKMLSKGVYGGTKEDFSSTLDRLEAMPIQVWLGSHPNQNGTFAKHQLLKQGAKPNPYIDPQGWKEFLSARIQKLQKLL